MPGTPSHSPDWPYGSPRGGLFLMSEVALCPSLDVRGGVAQPGEQGLFIDNLLVRIHFIIVMIRWTGLAPWEFTSAWMAGAPSHRPASAA